ncbi:MAG: xylulokinase [Spongiibacteraceae bacterium]|nr:xylulokinase [Spongiibacteraceae bacterium]
MSTILGIDLGTQSLKVVFYDFEARETVAVHSAPLDLHQHDNGVAEQRAEWWLNALQQALRQASKKVRQSVVAIGVSGQQHGFVPLNRAGQVLTPVKLWCDTSTRRECDAVMRAAGGFDACIAGAGNPILPGYTASKIRWFRDAHPDLYARMDKILLPHDYVNFYLTGEACMEAGDASGTGFLDIRTRKWSELMLAAIDPERDLRACLPEVQTANKPIGTLLASVADELSLPPGVPVSAGGGDNMMGAIGTGNVIPGVLTVSLGTSGTLYAHSDVPVIDPTGSIAAFCSSTGGWLPLLCTMNCTISTELIRRLVATDSREFESQINAAPPGSKGVMTLPFFNGERTPNLPNAKGVVLGLDGRNTEPANVLRSAVEGATYALRFGLDRLQELGISSNKIVLTGGGANSATWRQVVADVFNMSVTVLQQQEGAAFGAALQALAALNGRQTDMPTLVSEHIERDVQRCCDPRPAMVDIYNEGYNAYSQAVETISALYTTPTQKNRRGSSQ